MLIVGIALLLVILVVLRLTGGGPWPRRKSHVDKSDWVARQVVEACLDGRVARRVRDREVALGEVLLDLMDGLGVRRDDSLDVLRGEGFETDDLVTQRPDPVQHRSGGIEQAIERALLVGIQVARADDDHAGVGDEFLDLEGLVRRAEVVETELFGDDRLESYSFYGKAAIVLQDMMDEEPRGSRREVLVALLEVFDDRIERLQAEMSEAMERVPEPESLLWGDGRDRRLYYFKLGVTNSLRRSRQLESLAHLYRLKGVNYDVEEAYRLASRECPPLVMADVMQIEQLLQMGPGEIHGLVYRSLPRGDI